MPPVYGRRTGPRFRPGDRVETTAGCRQTGTVAPRHYTRAEWTDGSYSRPADYPRLAAEAVPVDWDNGTRGWTFAPALRLIPTDPTA